MSYRGSLRPRKLFGCRTYRIRIPHVELKRYGVVAHEICFLPNLPGLNNFKILIDEFSKYDMIIIQRCYLREIVETVRKAADFLNIPLVYETDDDYLNIPLDNPAHFSMISKTDMETHKNNLEELEKLRHRSLDNYKEIVSMMDHVIVSTEELRRSLTPYNKNISVFENNVEDVFPYKSYDPEHLFIEDGQVKVNNQMGMITIPSYVQLDEGKISPTPRIGWSSTVTHWGSDFATIMDPWEKIIEKYSKGCWFVYIGWERFVQWHIEVAKKKLLPQRVMHIPDSMYDLYLFHLRNLDIGIAPLAPNIFNMSKSDLKPLEYSIWGTPAVLPRIQTYKRHWKEGETCLMYGNAREFKESMELLINDHELRIKLGAAAKKYTQENRLERQHSKRRYLLYRELIEGKNKLRSFAPKEVLIHA